MVQSTLLLAVQKNLNLGLIPSWVTSKPGGIANWCDLLCYRGCRVTWTLLLLPVTTPMNVSHLKNQDTLPIFSLFPLPDKNIKKTCRNQLNLPLLLPHLVHPPSRDLFSLAFFECLLWTLHSWDKFPQNVAALHFVATRWKPWAHCHNLEFIRQPRASLQCTLLPFIICI